MKSLFKYIVFAGMIASPAAAQDTALAMSDTPIAATANQEECIMTMAEFPDDGHVARYQFFRLTQELASDTTPSFRSALDKYGEGEVDADTPILDVIENIANPVLRQAAPELAVANMDHLIDFADRCAPYLTGQIDSLRAYDADLSFEDPIINEDALFLRQVLSDSLSRLGADQDPVYSWAVQEYAANLVRTRDDIEFTSFVVEIDDLEALYMTDLDGRLARSNDIINKEMDRDSLADALVLNDDMNEDARRKSKQNMLRTLARILGGR